MATQTTPAKTAAPRKRAAATKATTAKATPAKAAPSTTDTATDPVDVVVFDLVQLDDTKSYAVFTAPEGSGCVGKLYVHHGVTLVRVKLEGPASA